VSSGRVSSLRTLEWLVRPAATPLNKRIDRRRQGAVMAGLVPAIRVV
jgi:hypothetical protein